MIGSNETVRRARDGFNGLLPDADAAVLRAMETQLMNPRVVKKAIEHAGRAIARDRKAGNVDALQAELTACEKAITRLTAATASGGDLRTLVAALETQGAPANGIAGAIGDGAHASGGA